MLTANRVRSLLDALHSGWDPLQELEKLTAAPRSQPRMWRGETGVVLEVDFPGRSAEDFDVNVEKNHLSVGLKEIEETKGSEKPAYRVHERRTLPGATEFEFPFSIHADHVDVTYQNGILRVSITKPEEEQRRQLSVRQA